MAKKNVPEFDDNGSGSGSPVNKVFKDKKIQVIGAIAAAILILAILV